MAGTRFSEGVLSRRLQQGAGGAGGHDGGTGQGKKAPKAGANGPRGGKSKLAPYNKKGAGSMLKKGQPGRVFKSLQNAKNPR